VENAIVAENLTKYFGSTKAIDSVSFTIKKGEIVGFLGPNGAGKSTTLRILCGLLRAHSGNAYIAGTSVALSPNLTKKHIGYMPENNPLIDELRVDEYLYFRARMKMITKANRRKEVDEAMELCDLTRTAKKKIIRTLSKGYRQRVGIADCLLGKPDIIIMDEPTIGLDPHQIIAIRQLIDSLRGKMTVVLSSHILPEIEASCDRVIIINRGHIVAQGSSKELREIFATQNQFKLTLTSHPEELCAKLQELDPSIKIIDERACMEQPWSVFTIETANKALSGQHFIQLLRDPKYELKEVQALPLTLEDIFLTATKQSWRDSSF